MTEGSKTRFYLIYKMLRPPIFYCLLDFKYRQPFILSFLLEITLTNIYLNLNGIFMPKVPKCYVLSLYKCRCIKMLLELEIQMTFQIFKFGFLMCGYKL